jgi:predicted RNA-binding Zn-ribbon protein involved in translation (DUF1610 family)
MAASSASPSLRTEARRAVDTIGTARDEDTVWYPYDPEDPNEERTFTTMMKAADLAPFVDTSGGVQLADREGVFSHSFRCRRCTLHFVLFSWSASRHTPDTIVCPECGGSGGFLHRMTVLSELRTFNLAPDRASEIYDVWPFRLASGRP